MLATCPEVSEPSIRSIGPASSTGLGPPLKVSAGDLHHLGHRRWYNCRNFRGLPLAPALSGYYLSRECKAHARRLQHPQPIESRDQATLGRSFWLILRGSMSDILALPMLSCFDKLSSNNEYKSRPRPACFFDISTSFDAQEQLHYVIFRRKSDKILLKIKS